MLSRQDLAATLGERTLHIKDVRKLAAAIAAYLLEQRRTADLEPLIRDIMQYRMKSGHIEANIVSAHPLPADVLKEVKQILHQQYPHAKELNLDTQIDPRAVGGVRIELPNEQLDLTVRSKLDTFKRLTTGEI